MKEKIKNIVDNRLFNYFLILIFSCFICIPLLGTVDLFQDDGIQHIARLIGTNKSIADNPRFPVIISNLCNNFGYSWNIFYSVTTAYVPLIFRLLGFSYGGCIKLFLFIITILSGISMYEFTRKVTNNSKTGLLAAIIYILLPYRLTDMYIRNALAEITSFIFLPMVFQGIYEILYEADNRKINMALIIGTVGLILTHTIVTMYTAIFAIIYLIANYKKINKNSLKKIIFSISIILLLTSFFLVPLLEHKLATEYEVFQKGRMSRIEVLEYFKLNFLQLVYTRGDSMTFELGLVSIIGCIFATFAIYKQKLDDNLKNHTVLFMILGIICTIMTLNIFPFEKLPEILCMIQFSFRLLEFIGFFFSFAAAVGFSYFCEKINTKEVIVIGIICFGLLIPLNSLIKYEPTTWKEEMLYKPIPVNDKTGRVHAGCASFEYLPTKAFKNLDYIKERKNMTYVLKGKADIKEEKNGTNMDINIKSYSDELILELPYIYYLGYEANLEYLENSNRVIEKIPIKESEKGFLKLNLKELEKDKEYKIKISYKGTTAMKISYDISFITLILLIICSIIKKSKNFNRKCGQKID